MHIISYPLDTQWCILHQGHFQTGLEIKMHEVKAYTNVESKHINLNIQITKKP